MRRQPREINSIEWYTILTTEKKEGEKFTDFEFVISEKDVLVVKLDDGRTYLLNDDLPTTSRSRSYQELRQLHLTDEEEKEFLRKEGIS